MHVGAEEDLAHYPLGQQDGQEAFTKYLEMKGTRLSDVVNVKKGPYCRIPGGWGIFFLLTLALIQLAKEAFFLPNVWVKGVTKKYKILGISCF